MMAKGVRSSPEHHPRVGDAPLVKVGSSQVDEDHLYDVYVPMYYVARQSGYAEVGVVLSSSRTFELLTAGDTLWVATSQLDVYEYPPTSARSLLFFLLNPSVDRVAEAAARGLESESLATAVDLWSLARDCVSGLRGVDFRGPSEYMVSAVFRLDNHPEMRKFAGVGSVYIYTSSWAKFTQSYLLLLQDDSGILENCYMTSFSMFSKMVSLLVPPSERRAAVKLLARAAERIRLAPPVVSGLLSTNPEWFGNQCKNC